MSRRQVFNGHWRAKLSFLEALNSFMNIKSKKKTDKETMSPNVQHVDEGSFPNVQLKCDHACDTECDSRI